MDGGLVPIVGPNIFLALVLKPLMSGGKAPEAAVEENAKKVWEEQAGPLLAYLEKQLGDNDFFVGNRLTIADISVASILVNPRHAGFVPERKRFPKLRAFLDRMWSRPSLQEADRRGHAGLRQALGADHGLSSEGRSAGFGGLHRPGSTPRAPFSRDAVCPIHRTRNQRIGIPPEEAAMESGSLPVVRIADDGELDDVRRLLEQLGVEWMAEDEEPDRATALWIGSPQRLIGERPPSATGGGAGGLPDRRGGQDDQHAAA